MAGKTEESEVLASTTESGQNKAPDLMDTPRHSTKKAYVMSNMMLWVLFSTFINQETWSAMHHS